MLESLIAEEPLHRVDAHRFIEVRPVAARFAWVVADASHCGGQGIVLHDLPPGILVAALLGVAEPQLDVLAGRAGVVARRQPIQVDRALGPPSASLVEQATADIEGDGERLGLYNGFRAHASPTTEDNKSNRLIFQLAIAWSAANWCSLPFLNTWAKRRCTFRYSLTGW